MSEDECADYLEKQRQYWEAQPQVILLGEELRAKAAIDKARYHYNRTETVKEGECRLKALNVPAGLICIILKDIFKGTNISASTVYAAVSADCKMQSRQESGRRAASANKKHGEQRTASRIAEGKCDNLCAITGGLCVFNTDFRQRTTQQLEEMRKKLSNASVSVQLALDSHNNDGMQSEQVKPQLPCVTTISSCMSVAGGVVVQADVPCAYYPALLSQAVVTKGDATTEDAARHGVIISGVAHSAAGELSDVTTSGIHPGSSTWFLGLLGELSGNSFWRSIVSNEQSPLPAGAYADGAYCDIAKEELTTHSIHGATTISGTTSTAGGTARG